MLKNVTLSAEGILIKQAREKAIRENKTLNVVFREWIRLYLRNQDAETEYEAFMNDAAYIDVGYNEK